MWSKFGVHAGLDLTTVWVDRAVFFDMVSQEPKWEKVKVFGLTCLQGRVPTFEILTSEGYVFSDVPPHLIRWKEPDAIDEGYPLSSLVYNNCLSSNFSLSAFAALGERKAYAYLKAEGKHEGAQYWFSLDFYENNNWYHCVKLDNGQVAFIPSHKLVFPSNGILAADHSFPKYQKLRHEFKV